ncbi:hypothetical protein [Reinekea sp. G2M2-21]|uniref:hypothetical protein n=1 Tax=Reinekea sp. G2M2-21 TaxID=2788942 RepID=UPI0018AB3F41|nr:hypothetical protein [Reinekea sp. G2M2-21]
MTTIDKMFADDDGYGDTNSARFAKDESGNVFIHCARRPSFLISGTRSDYPGAVCVTVNGSEYTSPKKMINAEERIQISNDSYPGSPYNAALIAAALNEHDIDLDGDSELVTGLPIRSFFDLNSKGFDLAVSGNVAEKKNGLSRFNVEVFSAKRKGQYAFPTERHFVVSEAVGVLIDVLYDDVGNRRNDWIFDGLDDDAFVLTIDMGSRTTDLCGLTRNLVPVRHTLKTINIGLNDVHARFRDLLVAEDGGQLMHDAGLTVNALTDDKVRKLFQDGEVRRMRSAERDTVSIQHLAEKAFTSIVRDDIVTKLGSLADDLSQVAAIIVAGGGAAVNGLMQHSLRKELMVDQHAIEKQEARMNAGQIIASDSAQGNKILCAPVAEHANVRGFLKWLAFIQHKLTASDIAGMSDRLPVLSR